MDGSRLGGVGPNPSPLSQWPLRVKPQLHVSLLGIELLIRPLASPWTSHLNEWSVEHHPSHQPLVPSSFIRNQKVHLIGLPRHSRTSLLLFVPRANTQAPEAKPLWSLTWSSGTASPLLPLHPASTVHSPSNSQRKRTQNSQRRGSLWHRNLLTFEGHCHSPPSNMVSYFFLLLFKTLL